jgi:cytochrome P450 family 9
MSSPAQLSVSSVILWEERNNEFYLMGKEATNFGGVWFTIKVIAFVAIPKLCGVLNIGLFSQKVAKFFTKLIKSNIESREKHGIVRPDMVNLLMEARKSGMTHEETQPNKMQVLQQCKNLSLSNLRKLAKLR